MDDRVCTDEQRMKGGKKTKRETDWKEWSTWWSVVWTVTEAARI